ncbi:aldehyde dehydrogenase family protein [Leisingera caerulea]|uniref:aldehyde dehydrogenase family protein n=1 Tax=Leisingera caerulea TaxID=506591 RepID=UPI000A033362|nr:aldehyde dehydrogenase family protein [Leisingera caerulea]
MTGAEQAAFSRVQISWQCPSKYRNAGQTCVCANRFFVQEGIHDAFVEKFTARVRGLRVGDGFGEDVQIGPMIDQAAVEKVEELVADATGRGGTISTGGKRHALGKSFFEPTVLTDVSPEFQIFHEEIFGPVAAIIKFGDPEEMYEMANRTPFGLAAYFYGQNLSRVWRTAEALDFGIVGANTGMISTEVAPFGGMKESGNGREGSKYGIEDYLEVKYFCLSI